MTGVDLSVVVPVYNESGTVAELTRRLVEVLRDGEETFELVFVDDGSRDGTPAKLALLGRAIPELRLISLATNFGQEAAVQAGFAATRGRWVVQLDGDLQHPPEEIPKLLALRDHGYEVIYGARVERKDPRHRVLASRLLSRIAPRVLGIRLPKDVTTFRVVEGDLARFVAALPEKRKFFSALFEWSGARTTSVPVAHAPRQAGRTKYDLAKLVNHTFDLVVGFSTRPLRAIGMLGLFIAVLGIGFGIYRVALKMAGVPVTMDGYTSIIGAVVILGGLHLIALSVIGEYVGRIFIQTQGRPLYRLRVESSLDGPALDGPALDSPSETREPASYRRAPAGAACPMPATDPPGGMS